MKTKYLVAFSIISLLAIVLAGLALAAPGIGTTFTYQGFLKDGGEPAWDVYPFVFRLYDDPDEGSQVGSAVALEDVEVVNGLFNVELDFGSSAFNGSARWLEISVAPPGSAEYVTLSPRQPLTPAPYSIFSGGVNWTNVANVPLDLDDGDDNTTYTAGLGLELDGTEFNVEMDTLTERVTAPGDNTVDILVETGDVGQYSSVTIGVDGMPLISFYDASLEALMVAHCNDILCSSVSTYVLDDSDGQYTSIAIGSDGLGLQLLRFKHTCSESSSLH